MERPRFLTRGWPLALAVVAVAAVAAPAATSKPTRQSASEVLAVQFGIGYEVTETWKNGDPSGQCGTGWRETKWTDEVDAGSGAPPPSTLDTIRGSLTDFSDPRLPPLVRKKLGGKFPWGWYNFAAVGPVHGTVLHRLVETGADTDCSSGSPVVKPFTPPQHDCGTRSLSTTKPVLTTSAVLGAGRRLTDPVLETLMQGSTAPNALYAITFSIAPPRPLFRSCDFDAAAPEYPTDVPMVLKKAIVADIAGLRVGGVYARTTGYAGKCRETTDPSVTCTFHVDLHVHILRVA